MWGVYLLHAKESLMRGDVYLSRGFRRGALLRFAVAMLIFENPKNSDASVISIGAAY